MDAIISPQYTKIRLRSRKDSFTDVWTFSKNFSGICTGFHSVRGGVAYVETTQKLS